MALSLCHYELILPLMKRIELILLACTLAVIGSTQENKRFVLDTDSVTSTPKFEPVAALKDIDLGYETEKINNMAAMEERIDSLHLPLLNSFGQVRMNMYPLGWNGLYNWNLHSGLNLNIGASVFATFGRKAWRGAGFG